MICGSRQDLELVCTYQSTSQSKPQRYESCVHVVPLQLRVHSIAIMTQLSILFFLGSICYLPMTHVDTHVYT